MQFLWQVISKINEHTLLACYSTCRNHPTDKLNSILKSRDITLLEKICIVKAMVFPAACVDLTDGPWRRLSTEELMLSNCGTGEDSWESLGLQGDPTSPF